ncbi:unnamed protein product [Kuraishia capsulata CBS 1993]|uniref:Uncharacterized protein n=1 Tax=Kuraishia capsulata CBS 1993 TaxID=1382522 RepID=W6MM76_9ASCO|nr:uncharacterized protein KUCA_T00003638001 [Kuraishia capsulata CBS 1993]CDK27659.1 unnamed protein product [Kuraishia capsulata CBS 1993]
MKLQLLSVPVANIGLCIYSLKKIQLKAFMINSSLPIAGIPSTSSSWLTFQSFQPSLRRLQQGISHGMWRVRMASKLELNSGRIFGLNFKEIQTQLIKVAVHL